MKWLFPDLAPEPTLPCISLWQPWASLWAIGRKKNETRDWATMHRGLILIHAAKTLDDSCPVLAEICKTQFGPDWRRLLPRGAIIGSCKVTGCVSTNFLEVDPIEYACGNYGPDRYAFRAVEHVTFPRPVPYRGLQTIFKVPRRVVEELVAA